MRRTELYETIRKDAKNGLSWNDIIRKNSLKSDYFIRLALGKKTGGNSEYLGRYKHIKKSDLKYLKDAYYFTYNLLIQVINKNSIESDAFLILDETKKHIDKIYSKE